MSARARQALADFEARDGSTAPPAPGASSPGALSSAAGARSPAAPAPLSPAPSGGALPVAQSSFIGRDHELAELIGLLDRTRLLTLIGPGGAGKTRLAVGAIRRRAPAGPGSGHPPPNQRPAP